MAGLLILFVAGLYIWVAYKIIFSLPKIWQRVLALIVLVLIPTADAVYGRIKLGNLCNIEGGLSIYKIEKEVEGIYMPSLFARHEWLTTHGYKFIEWEDGNGRQMRIERDSSGSVVERKDVDFMSRFAYERAAEQFGRGYHRAEQRIRDLETQEILAKSANISYEGGWVERLIGGLSGAGSGYAGSCRTGKVYVDEIVRKTLISKQ